MTSYSSTKPELFTRFLSWKSLTIRSSTQTVHVMPLLEDSLPNWPRRSPWLNVSYVVSGQQPKSFNGQGALSQQKLIPIKWALNHSNSWWQNGNKLSHRTHIIGVLKWLKKSCFYFFTKIFLRFCFDKFVLWTHRSELLIVTFLHNLGFRLFWIKEYELENLWSVIIYFWKSTIYLVVGRPGCRVVL